VFTGVMNYFPNVDGCEWLVREVLPRVIADHPQAKLTIVGSNPSRAVTRLARNPRVMVTGAVLDTRSYVRRAAIVVAPIRIARGIQNKVLEALAMGVPVVATSAAVQGVGGIADRDYVVADDAVTMAAGISNLISRDAERTALGARGRAFVESHYRWERSLDIFDEVFASVLSEAHST
jgi:glycosyltransferase involved in cell wall biosynthesis